MAATGSLLFSRELGINKSSVYISEPKGKRHKVHAHIFSAGLSSHTSLQEAWSVHLLTARESVKPTPNRCNILVCRSLFSPNGGDQIPILKTAAAVLARSYEAFHGRSLVVQLIPAVGIIAFAAWGLGPSLRACRILFWQVLDNMRRVCELNSVKCEVMGLTWGVWDESFFSLQPQVILGADVLYDSSAFDNLFATVKLLLENSPGSVFITSYHNRSGHHLIEFLMVKWQLKCVKLLDGFSFLPSWKASGVSGNIQLVEIAFSDVGKN